MGKDLISSDSTDRTNEDKRAVVRRVSEAYKFMGRAYAFLRGVARTENVALYDLPRAVKDRIAQLEGAGEQQGIIEVNQALSDQIEDFAKRFKKIRKEDLDRLAKEEQETFGNDGGVTKPQTDLKDPRDVLG